MLGPSLRMKKKMKVPPTPLGNMVKAAICWLCFFDTSS